jgi:hypothetical protein
VTGKWRAQSGELARGEAVTPRRACVRFLIPPRARGRACVREGGGGGPRGSGGGGSSTYKKYLRPFSQIDLYNPLVI